MIMIAYYFNLNDGVGAKRSRFLCDMLNSKSNSVSIIDKDAFGHSSRKNRLLWLFRCMLFLLRIKKQVVYISCGPFWHLFFVSLICFLKRHKLFVDFRDPWSLNVKKEPRGLKKLIRWTMAICIEKFVYSVTEKFIVCTPGMFKLYGRVFGDDTKLLLALNGHEIGKNVLSSLEKKIVPYKIVCLGKFLSYGERYLTAYKQLCKQLKKLNVDYHMFFIGADEATCINLSNDARVHILPRMTYGEVINFVLDAQMAILSIRDEDFDFGTKVFDYIALGIPMYDWFDHNKSFYNFFKAYMTTDLANIPNFKPDVEEKFYRGNCLHELCNILINREEELH